ncbi:MAG: hypothetical protein ACT4PW_04095 [Acidimicrobiia bacterium]
MRNFRRALVALGVAGVVAAALRLRGNRPDDTPQDGGWRELDISGTEPTS